MCGLLAGSGKIREEEIISLGVSNITRGDDSAGIGYLDKSGASTVAKIAEHPAVAFARSLRPAIQASLAGGVVIGHTRFATTGSVINQNAHPFLADGIAFAHNGIISNHKKFGSYEVDSEALIHGIKKRDFSEYQGCVALVWIEGGKLYAYASGNPLFRGRLDGASYLASEKEFLERLGCTHVKSLSTEKIYIFDGDKVSNVIPCKGPKSMTVAYSHSWPDNDGEFGYDGYNIGQWEKRQFFYGTDTHKTVEVSEASSIPEKSCLNCGIEEPVGLTDYCYPCGQKYGIFSVPKRGER